MQRKDKNEDKKDKEKEEKEKEKELEQIEKIWEQINAHQSDMGKSESELNQQEAIIKDSERAKRARNASNVGRDKKFDELELKVLEFILDEQNKKSAKGHIKQIFNNGIAKGKAEREIQQIDMTLRQAYELKDMLSNEIEGHKNEIKKLRSKFLIGINKNKK